ncbi:MAG: hypothetical protein C5B56_10995 [Proteobacteria bacterium]|nr:MAG: hypothetical protein C5B56_10995 [Pseudomonadota bacterium]
MQVDDREDLRREADRLFRWAKMLGDPKAARALTAHATFLVERAIRRDAETAAGGTQASPGPADIIRHEKQFGQGQN